MNEASSRRLGVLAILAARPLRPASHASLQPMDVFDLESRLRSRRSAPDGSRVVYVRSFMDVMKDRRRSNLWIVDENGTRHRPLTSGSRTDVSPRWSPTETGSPGSRPRARARRRFTSATWTRGETAGDQPPAQPPPSGLAWSPDGRHLAFFMHVPDRTEAPRRAAGPARRGGVGPAAEDHRPARLPGRRRGLPARRALAAVRAACRRRDPAPADRRARSTTVAGSPGRRTAPSCSSPRTGTRTASTIPSTRRSTRLRVADGARARPHARAADRTAPPPSRLTGGSVAYVGFDDAYQFYQVTRLYVMNRDGSGARCLTEELERDVESPAWAERRPAVSTSSTTTRARARRSRSSRWTAA